MRSVLLRSLAVIGVGGLVLGGVLYVASTVDSRPPELMDVVLTQTAGDDDNLGLITTSLEIVFSEPVEPDDAAAAITLEPAAAGTVSLSGSSAIFTPHDPLELETEYILRVAPGIRDMAGNAMAEAPPPFEFSTAGRPTLLEAAPADGDDEVALDAPISLTFSALMDTASVEGALRLRPNFAHHLRWSGALLEIVPSEPLRPGRSYEVSVHADAADIAGVTLGEPVTVAFRTVAPGLAARTLIPADGIDGIATTSPIAIIFDLPIDPGSVDGSLLTIVPDVAGTLEVLALPDDPEADDGSGSVLRFVPSGPLPANTTFEVELAVGVTTPEDGGGLAGPVRWTFTTGTPLGAVSNQITFVTDRGGIPNVWAMNPDGTGQRQLTAELTPVLDYAVAPDGSSLVIADGRRLIFQRADGGGRQVLTEAGVIEFDPAYAPSGGRVAFARADAETGVGLGLWEWRIDGGEAESIALPPDVRDDPSPSGDPDAPALRYPRYAPDGQALAFVDLSGSIGILELPNDRLTRVPFVAAGPPIWQPGSAGIIVNGARLDGPPREATLTAPVTTEAPEPTDGVFRLSRSGTTASETSIPLGRHVVAIAADGSIAYVDRGGSLFISRPGAAVAGPAIIDDWPVVAAAFAPGEPTMVVVLGTDADRGRIELLDLESVDLTPLVPDGSLPRWLP